MAVPQTLPVGVVALLVLLTSAFDKQTLVTRDKKKVEPTIS